MKNKYFLLAIILVILVTAVILRLSGPEDAWLCQNGNWIKHGEPRTPPPSAACGAISQAQEAAAVLDEGSDAAGEVMVFSPQPGAKVSPPLVIKGQARGSWFFEASLPVKLLDADGQVIAAHYGTADSDWMTSEFVPFTSILNFETTATSGFLVISKDNPSGLPENEDSWRQPVEFLPLNN